MPEFMYESGVYVPLSGTTIAFNPNSAIGLPSGEIISDVELRLISDALTTLNGEMIFVPSSGVVLVASGGEWKGFVL